MKIKFLLKELVNSLCANKRQTLLTMGSLMIGIMSILLVLGLGNGVQDSISRQIADVTGGEKGSSSASFQSKMVMDSRKKIKNDWKGLLLSKRSR